MRPTTTACLALLAVLLGGCAADVPVVQVQAVPSPTSPTPTDEPTGTPMPTEPATPTETPTATEEAPRDPTDTDRARFVAEYRPDGAQGLQGVAADLGGEGVEELVFRYVRGGIARVDVAWWGGTAYEVVFRGEGGPATSIERLRTADVNGDGLTEIVTSQVGSGPEASVSLWQVVAPREVVPLVAVGGCHAGGNTYGVVGAELTDRNVDGADEVYATCDDTPLPVSEWSTDRYVWADGAYRFVPEPE